MNDVKTVYILTRTPINTLGGQMEIVAVFGTRAALEARIISMVRGNKLEELSGLGMQTHTVMES